MHDELGEQRIEARARRVAGVAEGIDAHARPDGGSNAVSVPPAGRTAAVGGRCVSMLMRSCIAKPRGARHGAPAQAESGERRAAGEPQLRRWTRSMPVTSSVTVCSTCRRGFASMKANALRRRSAGIDQELERAEAVVAARSRAMRTARRDERVAQPRRQRGARRDLDQLLVPALDAAVALPEVGDCAGAVADDLHLDVARVRQQPLDVDVAVAERRLRLGPAARVRLVDVLGGRAHGAHAAAAAAGDRLDHHRAAVAQRREERARASSSVVASACPAAPGRRSRSARARAWRLVAEQLQQSRARADEGQPGLGAARGRRRRSR